MIENECQCHDHSVLKLTRKNLSYAISGVAFLFFICFVTGYFIGKRQAVADVIASIEKDSFADRIHYSLNSLYDKKQISSSDKKNNEQEIESDVKDINNISSVSNLDQKSSPNEKKIMPAVDSQEKHYYAELVGFGYEKSANRFANRLNKRGINVIVKIRRSKTAKGVVRHWYQVITKRFDNLNELESLIAMLRKDEKLHDVRIKCI